MRMPEEITAYAHTTRGPVETWEPLREHLENVAQLAARFGAAFHSKDWGHLAGLWHDLGKYRPEFQRKLRGSGEQIEHAGLGASLAADKGAGGHSLAFVIAGHHCGLANRDAQGDSGLSPLKQRLAGNKEVLDQLRNSLPVELLSAALPSIPEFLTAPSTSATRRRWELWTRMLFSSLVDADRLATESFYEPLKTQARGQHASIADLLARLNTYLARFKGDNDLNRDRARVLEDCRHASKETPGFFSLTAPTGTGKTLSALAFALEHARTYSLGRVIVVVPYTSIIEQNAAVYRDALGMENVIEHHASIDEESRKEQFGETEARRRLAAENWDAPVVVTTTVQLFESLLSNHPSRCRKLHNVVRSVIVLDEAQSLPAGYLACLLDVMKELVASYSCSIVFATATQPALGQRHSLPEGLEGVREIVEAPAELAQRLKRVRIHWPDPQRPLIPYDELAREIVRHDQVLVVVHLRKDARRLARALPEEARYHLSALMCAAHRSVVLDRVRSALRRGERCRLVATQLVEAGVDLDFPVVYRALAGLDSLAQAAGRCNREGLRAEGKFVVFRAETKPPPGILRIGLDVVEGMLTNHGNTLDFATPTCFDEYFRTLYHAVDMDRFGVQGEREQLNFANVDRLVNLVEDGYRSPLVVSWADADARLSAYERAPNRDTLRALQPFLVQVPRNELDKLESLGAARPVNDAFWALTSPFQNLYDSNFGFVHEDALPDPAALIT